MTYTTLPRHRGEPADYEDGLTDSPGRHVAVVGFHRPSWTELRRIAREPIELDLDRAIRADLMTPDQRRALFTD